MRMDAFKPICPSSGKGDRPMRSNKTTLENRRYEEQPDEESIEKVLS